LASFFGGGLPGYIGCCPPLQLHERRGDFAFEAVLNLFAGVAREFWSLLAGFDWL